MVNMNGELMHRDRPGSALLIRRCKAATPCGKDYGFTAVAFSNYTSISIGWTVSAKALSFAEIPPRRKIITEIKRTFFPANELPGMAFIFA